MANLWPWLAIAGLGVLHGANPANGWMFAAACGLRSPDPAAVRRALLPIAVGHAASIGLVAWAFAMGLSTDRSRLQALAGLLLVGVASCRSCLRSRRSETFGRESGYAGIALWSFLMASVHGAGMMLVPVLVPLCLAGTPAREITATGSLLAASTAVGVHTAAMLLTTGALATGVSRRLAMHPCLLTQTALRRMWTAMLAATGAMLIVLSGFRVT